MGPGDLPWEEGDPLVRLLLDEGYAVAGTGGGPLFWPLEPTFVNQEALLDRFACAVREPDLTVAWGLSIGGITTAGLVQRMPDRLSAALPICGNLAGSVATCNRELDVAFVIKVLLGADLPLEVVRIADPDTNLSIAHSLLDRARRSPAGRARLALAAAVGGIPGWHSPVDTEPGPHETGERLANQLAWFGDVNFLVYFLLRCHIERRAGGNPSWNHDSDYRVMLEMSANRDLVDALYATAPIDLAGDLQALADAPRIEEDHPARCYLERNIVFSGDLGGVPVLALHTEGDGLVAPDHERAYADAVDATGQQALLRQLFVHRGGHCTLTGAEVLVALGVLLERVATGVWPALEPAALRDAAAALGDARNLLTGSSSPVAPAFSSFSPFPFPRPYDGRHAGGRRP